MQATTITALRPADRERWSELWAAYLRFYEVALPQSTTDATWARIVAGSGEMFGLGIRLGGPEAPLAGIVHYIFHQNTWTPDEVCYLEDLFVDPEARGFGCGRQLIETVAAAARERGCFRLYWLTQESNATARRLYDRVAVSTGFIRYDYPL
jgi:GNAT superfamily N-acetyltransferase